MSKEKQPTPPSSGDGKAPAACTTTTCPLALPEELPANCSDAPTQINLPKQVNDSMQASYKNSFPNGKSQERGGIMVKDSAGNIEIVNEGTGTSGTFSPNRVVGSDEKIIGTYHTHPYDQAEGGYQGVSFSGADINYANYYKEPIYVDAGTKQFMVIPTQETSSPKTDNLTSEWDKEFGDALNNGKSIQEASASASHTIAKKYKMAYYEGKNGELKKLGC